MNIVRCNRVFYYNKLNSEPSKRQVTCRLDIVDKRQRAVSKLIGIYLHVLSTKELQ